MEINNEEEVVLKRTMMGRCALATITKNADGKIQYGCKECPVKLFNKELIEHHLFLHYKEFRFLCAICGVGLKRREHLERHTQGHLEVRPHSCPECGKAFKRKEHLSIHRSIHSGDKNMNCPICNKSFYRKDHLQKHLQTHNKLLIKGLSEGDFLNFKQELVEYDETMSTQEDIPVDYDESDILPEDSTSEDDIKMEIDEDYVLPERTVTKPRSSGGHNARPFACTVCDKTYKRRDHLKLHSLTHVKKENGCDECGKAFHSAELLLDHVSRVHGDDYGDGTNEDSLLVPIKSIIGSPLGPEFVRHIPHASDLLVTRATPEYRPHECTVCHRKFKRRQHLKVHANVHLKMEPTVWCSLCHAGFYTNYQFERHRCSGVNPEGSSEDPENSEPVAIRDARKENNYPSDFIEIEENIKIVDESRLDADGGAEVPPDDDELNIPTPVRVFVCKYCSKPFKRKDHYRIHLHIHTGVKSFFCPYCQKGFYRKDHMKKHALVHEKPKPPLKAKPKKQLPDLYPIEMAPRKDVKPEITIHAPSNTKLRVPLSIKVPYKMVMSLDNGEQRAVTVDPHAERRPRLVRDNN